MGVKDISERIAVLKIKLRAASKLITIQVYASTMAAEKKEREKFYNLLRLILERGPEQVSKADQENFF